MASDARNPALDGLRLTCCAAVVAGHAAWGPFAGKLATFGVDVFFALSGFLITSLLLREHSANGTADLRAFWTRRALRILPAYFASLIVPALLTLVFTAWFTRSFHGPSDRTFFTTTLAAYALMVGNFSLGAVPTPMAVLWSVCIEEQFYAFFPPTISHAKRKWPVLIPVVIGLAFAWATRILLASRHDVALYRNTMAHADGLLLGALLAQFAERIRALVARHAFAIEAVAIAASTALLVLRSGSSPFAYWATYFASACCATALVAAFALGRGPVARVLAYKPIAYLGTLTYSGYLVHMYGVTAAFGVTRRVPFGAAEVPARIAMALAFTFALAWIAHVAIERPFLRLKNRFATAYRTDRPDRKPASAEASAAQ
jgi:peptidoglycan/LPS O-acetylase OafA/YrhL